MQYIDAGFPFANLWESKCIFIHLNIFHHNFATVCAALFPSLLEPTLNLLHEQEVASSVCENIALKCWFCTCKLERLDNK